MKMKYQTVAGLVVIWLVLGTGLASAGTLTVSLSPSLDNKGDIIRAISITKAELFETRIEVTAPAVVGTVVSDNIALFNLSGIKPGDYFIKLNNRSDYLFPTRIDYPTKDISQFVGRTLRVSVIGNLSDPVYIFKTYFNGLGPVNCSDGYQVSPNSIIKLSLKTDPQKLEVNTFGIFPVKEDIYVIGMQTILDSYTPTTPNHPSTSTSTNPPFSKWVFSHGADYGGDDSKCNSCHGNLDTKPSNLNTKRDNFIEIPVNKGFCYRCHYGKSGINAGLVGEPGCRHTYTSPGFEALSAIAALLAVLLIKRK